MTLELYDHLDTLEIRVRRDRDDADEEPGTTAVMDDRHLTPPHRGHRD